MKKLTEIYDNITDCYNLNEALITFANKAYPSSGNVVIMAGGAGSGKGFVLNNLIGLEGKIFDVDALKSLATRTPKLIKRVKDELNIDLSKLDATKNKYALKEPENVSLLHEIIGDELNIPNKQQQLFFANVLTKSPDLKPNVIFDVTLKDLNKLNSITRMVKNVGYDPKNIHIVWAVNSIDVALKQNKKRPRTVPTEILVNTHRGVSQTMNDIIRLGDTLKKYMDGDIVIVFNKEKVDSELIKSELPPGGKGIGSGKVGKYIKNANYTYIKKSGNPVLPINKIGKDILYKISDYVPKNVEWI